MEPNLSVLFLCISVLMHVPMESPWHVCVVCVRLLKDALLCILQPALDLESWGGLHVSCRRTSRVLAAALCFLAESADFSACTLGWILGLTLSVIPAPSLGGPQSERSYWEVGVESWP